MICPCPCSPDRNHFIVCGTARSRTESPTTDDPAGEEVVVVMPDSRNHGPRSATLPRRDSAGARPADDRDVDRGRHHVGPRRRPGRPGRHRIFTRVRAQKLSPDLRLASPPSTRGAANTSAVSSSTARCAEQRAAAPLLVAAASPAQRQPRPGLPAHDVPAGTQDDPPGTWSRPRGTHRSAGTTQPDRAGGAERKRRHLVPAMADGGTPRYLLAGSGTRVDRPCRRRANCLGQVRRDLPDPAGRPATTGSSCCFRSPKLVTDLLTRMDHGHDRLRAYPGLAGCRQVGRRPPPRTAWRCCCW